MVRAGNQRVSSRKAASFRVTDNRKDCFKMWIRQYAWYCHSGCHSFGYISVTYFKRPLSTDTGQNYVFQKSVRQHRSFSAASPRSVADTGNRLPQHCSDFVEGCRAGRRPGYPPILFSRLSPRIWLEQSLPTMAKHAERWAGITRFPHSVPVTVFLSSWHLLANPSSDTNGCGGRRACA